MRIGIDIDGVLTDLEQYQLDCGSKYVYEHFKSGVVNGEAYETFDILGIDNDTDDLFWKEYLEDYATLEPARKFAAEVIGKLRSDGYEIYIITARYLTDRNDELGLRMRTKVKDWLLKNGICYDKLIFSPEDKLNVCKDNSIDLMIEDKVDNIKKISEVIPVICFNASYNRDLEGNNIIRCYSWYDIYSKIKKDC